MYQFSRILLSLTAFWSSKAYTQFSCLSPAAALVLFWGACQVSILPSGLLATLPRILAPSELVFLASTVIPAAGPYTCCQPPLPRQGALILTSSHSLWLGFLRTCLDWPTHFTSRTSRPFVSSPQILWCSHQSRTAYLFLALAFACDPQCGRYSDSRNHKLTS